MDQFRGGLGEAWASVATFLPKLVAFLLILIIGLIIAKVVAKVIERVLERVGFDRMVERGGIKRALDRSTFDASDLLAKLVYYIAALFVLQLAFGVFGPNPISELIQGIIGYLPRVFVAIIIVVIGSAVAAAVREIVVAALGGLSYGRTLGAIAAGAILVVAAFAALSQLQIAPAIVNGLFYAMLAIIVGASVIAFGGGGIPVARRYVEQWARKADEETSRMSEAAEGSQERIRARAEQRKAQAQDGDREPTSGATREEHRDETARLDRTTEPTREVDLREAETRRRR